MWALFRENVLVNQSNWVISRKELEFAVMCYGLMQAASKSFRHLKCNLHFWTDSLVVLRWIINSDLHLPRFVKRRIDKIHCVAAAEALNYVKTSSNPADIGTRGDSFKKSSGHPLWINSPDFLWLHSNTFHDRGDLRRDFLYSYSLTVYLPEYKHKQNNTLSTNNSQFVQAKKHRRTLRFLNQDAS